MVLLLFLRIFFCVLLLTELPTLSQSLPLTYFSPTSISPTLILFHFSTAMLLLCYLLIFLRPTSPFSPHSCAPSSYPALFLSSNRSQPPPLLLIHTCLHLPFPKAGLCACPSVFVCFAHPLHMAFIQCCISCSYHLGPPFSQQSDSLAGNHLYFIH